MPIISPIGRKAPRVRFLIYCIYTVLTLGAVTMVYPFLIMLAGSTKSGVDVSDFSAIPKFLHDDLELYRKHTEGLFNESLDYMNIAYNSDAPSFEVLDYPQDLNAKRIDAWEEFITSSNLPPYTFALGYTSTVVSRTISREIRGFKAGLQRQYGNDLEALNRSLGTEFATWHSIFLRPDDFLLRREKPQMTPFANAFREYKVTRDMGARYYFSVEGFYRRLFLKPQYTKDIAEYNRLHGTSHESYDEVELPRHYPADAPEPVRTDWETFVRNTLNLLWVRVEARGTDAYRRFLAAKYGAVDPFNTRYGTEYASFAEVPLVGEPPAGGIVASDWEAFIAGWRDPDTGLTHQAPLASLRIHGIDFMFRDWLMEKYGSLAHINREFATEYASLLDILPPQREFHYREFLEDRSALRREFVTRNYRAVLEYMLFHGRGIYNTVVYCALAIALALLVNPIAAYAMSRYRMPTTYKLLLFLLLTMAFPPMVTQIPVFLMLRELGLLNTFAALLLPGMANGYSIFLLKGFFDSLPRELYESASIDGANEWVMFWQITMTLSKPILAVIALNTFTMAYSNFMFALLLCQDQKMWTLMVWLYQLQGRSGPGVVYASLIIAGIPTLLVFVFCQNIIMRGIVVPVEK